MLWSKHFESGIEAVDARHQPLGKFGKGPRPGCWVAREIIKRDQGRFEVDTLFGKESAFTDSRSMLPPSALLASLAANNAAERV